MRTLAVGTLSLALALAACSGEKKPLVIKEGDVVKVTGVIKGDEVTVEGKGGASVRLRLVGIQAFSAVINDPQLNALSAGAISATTDLVKGQSVTVSFDKQAQDSSGRYLGYLAKDGADVAKQLITEGWAVVYTEFPFSREADYLATEIKARDGKKNLWGLKPAADLVRGLRKQWAEARPQNGSEPLTDPLASAAP